MAGTWLGRAVLLAVIAAPAAAKERPDAFLKFGERMEAPRGFTEMCSNDRAVCDKMAETMDAPPAPPLAGVRLPTVVRPHVELVAQGLERSPLELVNLFDPFDLPPKGPSIFKLKPTFTEVIDSVAAPRGYGDMLVPTAFSLSTPLGLARLALKDGQRGAVMLARPPVPPFSLSILSNTWPVLPAAPQMPQSPILDVPRVTSNAPVMSLKVLKILLKRVNARVNANVSQQSDERIYGRAELWRPSGDDRRAAGDCEDIAIQKRLELIDAKFPADRLFFAVVYRSGVGLHTVLVARLDDGDVVLDSRVNYIQKWSSTGYSWVSVQSPTAPSVWRALV